MRISVWRVPTPSRGTVVIKVGGSLFDWRPLKRKLTALLNTRLDQGQKIVLLAGGGSIVDALRKFCPAQYLSRETAHDLAMRGLDLTAHMLHALLVDVRCTVIDELKAIDPTVRAGRIPILAPRRVLEDDERFDLVEMEHSWDLTSDSIAAYMAARLKSKELVLLKSVDPPSGCDVAHAARIELVDRCFPSVAKRVKRVVYLNLRSEAAENAGVELFTTGDNESLE